MAPIKAEQHVRSPRRTRALQRRDNLRNIVSARLKEARLAHQPPYTLQLLSIVLEEHEKLEISWSTLGKIEAGVRGCYDYEIKAFAMVLGVTTDWLLGGSNVTLSTE